MRLLAMVTTCLVAGACSGGSGDDDDDDFGLRTGSYTISGAALVGPDECDLPDLYSYELADLDGTTFEITDVTSDDVTFLGSGVLPREGNAIGGVAETVFSYDWNVPGTPPQGTAVLNPYACVEEDFLTVTYTILTETTLEYSEYWTATATAGSASECIVALSSGYGAALLDFPCETTITADMVHD